MWMTLCHQSQMLNGLCLLRCAHQLIRIQAQVLAGTGSLNSPLTNRRCVSYNVSARRNYQLPPLFEVSESINLLVMPIDDKSARIRIAADAVKLSNIMHNWYFQSGTLAKMPQSWRDKAFRDDHGTLSIDSVLEFNECIVEVGCLLTLVGELHRDEDGVLQLRPYEDPLQKPKAQEQHGIPGSSQDLLLTDVAKPGEKTKGIFDTVPPSSEKDKEAITGRFVLASDDANLFVWGDGPDDDSYAPENRGLTQQMLTWLRLSEGQ
mmetsp:Transcript_22555/g.41141  ORF Transcript_22555/g.41141 Transcript_22555/m.41141 type:complete len:263 (-) Transcript_22555:88-876(-)